MALGSIRDIYSQDTLELEKQLKAIEAAKPGAFQSNYGETINGLMDQIINQKDFKYDFNADPLYKQYKDQYTQLGKQASMDAAANVSALTGGFGNSYAATAATQANQQYLNQLNNVIPELYQLAMDKYQMDTSRLYDQFSAVGAQEDREYGRHRDTVNDWYIDRDYALNRFNSSIGNDQYVSNYNQSEAQAAAQAAARYYSGGNSNESSSEPTKKVASTKTVESVSNVASNMIRANNTEGAYEYLDYLTKRGTISEEQANSILDEVENKPLLNTANPFLYGAQLRK